MRTFGATSQNDLMDTQMMSLVRRSKRSLQCVRFTHLRFTLNEEDPNSAGVLAPRRHQELSTFSTEQTPLRRPAISLWKRSAEKETACEVVASGCRCHTCHLCKPSLKRFYGFLDMPFEGISGWDFMKCIYRSLLLTTILKPERRMPDCCAFPEEYCKNHENYSKTCCTTQHIIGLTRRENSLWTGHGPNSKFAEVL